MKVIKSSQPGSSNSKENYFQQRIRRAKLAVNGFLGATLLSGFLTLSGVYLAISGDIPEGVEISKVGMIGTVELTKRTKDANDRLDQVIKDAMEEDEAEKNS
ncbi:hypothetical protein [Brasilonema sp. UFV-L1]|uniref:hypothetical protein n=1 Tax=Brasilonema sp. UFV-L1 TaxID=2234130 RepID=UPI00145F22B0|nr:hypothetical protein [Brasilonema sp. UFV-L1]NMG09576.1 hypothetical protein [Brasilonema sp. UFV-L1]